MPGYTRDDFRSVTTSDHACFEALAAGDRPLCYWQVPGGNRPPTHHQQRAVALFALCSVVPHFLQRAVSCSFLRQGGAVPPQFLALRGCGGALGAGSGGKLHNAKRCNSA
eukprot:11506274-Alexandrium_andersonii.AAC.1